MKLKSIHICGFKSFADRTVVFFDDGITGVIGPNGSGKSNIIDAVRWVMGEQTAKNLRADDPTDIIFSGSQDRKPLGFAEVTLTFSNDGLHCPPEYLHLPEVSIGRRIHRGGDREYYINREPCRLKDIVDFLLSIGLGSKSYGIIQQDKRDRIIQASPEGLREILEETAGITVFKMRRKEAEKRMESTLDRIKSLSEIESELSRQKEALADQVEKATLKFSYMQELKEKEISLLINHITYYNNIAEKVREEISKKNEEVEKTTIETSEWETNANELRVEQIEVVQQVKSAENELDDNRILLTKYTERIDNFKRQAQEREKQKERLTHDMQTERENLQREEDRRQMLLGDLEKAESLLRRIDSEVETIHEQLESTEESLQVERARCEEIRSEMRAIDTTRYSLRAKNETFLESISKFHNQIQKILDGEKVQLELKGQMVADRQAVLNDLQKITKGLDSRALEKQLLDTQFEEVKFQLDQAQDEKNKFRENHISATSQCSGLEKLIASGAGLSDGAVHLKENASQKFCGFLFEHVRLHLEDEPILEKAQPHLFQAALVDNLDGFIELLDKAEENNFSRIHFLVKDIVLPLNEHEIKLRSEILSFRGMRCVGERLEKTNFPWVKPIFDRIFICQDEWIALKAQKICGSNHSFLFITERSSVFSASYPVAFGEENGGQSNGILQRKREYEEALVQKLQSQEALAASEGTLFVLSEKIKIIDEKRKEIHLSLEQERVDTLKLSNQMEQFDLKIKHVQESLSRFTSDKEKIEVELFEVKEVFSKNQLNIEKLDGEYKTLDRELVEFDSEYQERKEQKDELSSMLQNKKSERAVLFERQHNVRQNYEEISFQMKRIEQKVDQLTIQFDHLESQLTSGDHDFENLHHEISHLQTKVKVQEEKLLELHERENELSEEIRVLESKLKTFKDQSQSKQKFITEKQLELARLETILDTSLKDAQQKYGLSLEQIQNTSLDDLHEKHFLESRIKELQDLITELGAVNERAVEEFTDVATRLHFLLSQKQDIEKSMEELKSSIEDIEQTTKIRFKEIYDKVNIQFQKLFPVLFPGGQAELHLLNEADLLTTGVEILVRLPGKKMQNMSLFSGGEKALTAISLIFSLLKTTPAPFCFLDEVDAPLDEANVGRFNDILEALSHEFQFVVITHNRRTMEVLDTIYGISMTEPGVSKMVSVDLSDVPEHLKKKKGSSNNRVGATASEN